MGNCYDTSSSVSPMRSPPSRKRHIRTESRARSEDWDSCPTENRARREEDFDPRYLPSPAVAYMPPPFEASPMTTMGYSTSLFLNSALM